MVGIDVALGALIGYGLGCFLTGYYWVKLRLGTDIRDHGSGSAGARNVGRLTGPGGFAITFVGDVLKGVLAVTAASHAGLAPPASASAMAGVVVGHIWPIQLGFRGGRGIAPALGAFLAFDPVLTAILALPVLPIRLFLRDTTRSGLFAIALSPILALVWTGEWISFFAATMIAILVLASHRTHLLEVRRGMFGFRDGMLKKEEAQ